MEVRSSGHNLRRLRAHGGDENWTSTDSTGAMDFFVIPSDEDEDDPAASGLEAVGSPTILPLHHDVGHADVSSRHGSRRSRSPRRNPMVGRIVSSSLPPHLANGAAAIATATTPSTMSSERLRRLRPSLVRGNDCPHCPQVSSQHVFAVVDMLLLFSLL